MRCRFPNESEILIPYRCDSKGSTVISATDYCYEMKELFEDWMFLQAPIQVGLNYFSTLEKYTVNAVLHAK
jgi:hypothetical protein